VFVLLFIVVELLHCYTFTSSKVSDSVVGELYEGSLVGGVTISDGKAHFANNAYIIFPVGVGLTGTYKVITIEMWADLPSILGTATFTSLFIVGESSAFLYCAHIQSQGEISCSFCTSPTTCSTMTSVDSYSSTSIHLVATFDSISGSMSLYVNSVWQCSGSFGASLPDSFSSSFNFAIGGTLPHPSAKPFLGSVDEFRVWAGPLPQSMITSHFENGPTPQDIGMIIFLSSLLFLPFPYCCCSSQPSILFQRWHHV
jgi:hypothetical protein